jgi:putative NADPH-quinone reductase
MKKLIILAHPSSTSFSHSIAKKYEESATSAGHEVTVLNLYTSELRQEFFEFADIKNLPSDPKRGTLQLLIKKTDTLVFIYPLWW